MLRARSLLTGFLLAATLVALFGGSPLPAQPTVPAQSTVPEKLRATLDAIGFSNSMQATMDLYLPLLAKAPKDGIEVKKNLAYGTNPRNLLDVYRAKGASGVPVMVFVHGGGYRSGERDLNEQVYGNVPTWFARNGMLAVNATYRLAPQDRWPSGGEDMAAVVGWVKAHAREYGGDPERIFMMGHSAGATHVATYAFDPRFQPTEGHGLSGIILVSGRYRVAWDSDDPGLEGVRQFFGVDPKAYGSRSPITYVSDSDIPAFLVTAEYDQRNLVETTGELFSALCRRDDGRCPRLLQLRYHNHLSEIFHINTEDDLLGREILDFVRRGARQQLERARLR